MGKKKSLSTVVGVATILVTLAAGSTAVSQNTWTGWFSEEQGWKQCPAGTAMKGLKCKGKYCDNKSLLCHRLPKVAAITASKSRSNPFSEEQYSYSVSHHSHNYHYNGNPVTGMHCSGRYCDNIRLEYTVGAAVSTAQCQMAPYISEEKKRGIGNIFVCPGEDRFVAGMACQGNYCDNVSLFCCQMW